jgi:hypothetical protein
MSSLFLTGTLIRCNADPKYDYKFIPETRPCCNPGCSGLLSNVTLPLRIDDASLNISLYNRPMDIQSYPDIFKIVNEYNIRDNGSWSIKYKFDVDDYCEDGMCTYPSKFDLIMCNKCNEFCSICVKCKQPCILASHSGYFCNENVGKSNNIWLYRYLDDNCKENIVIHSNKNNIPIEAINPTGNRNIIIEGDEEDVHDSYDIIDKKIIWSFDKRLNLQILAGDMSNITNNYIPMLTGPDGGFGINYYCSECKYDDSFNDK